MGQNKDIDSEEFRSMRHDIKNQLSNINLLVAQLKHDMQDAPPDQLDYLEIIAQTASRIDDLLKRAE